MDVHSPEQRSFNMSRIRSKDTKPELKVRKWLWKNGYRYRLHVKGLPGKPDIVFRSKKAVIFVHGCFWHKHNCKYAGIPKTHSDFWLEKLNHNVARDTKNIHILQTDGWRVLVLWECEIKEWEKKALPKLELFLLATIP